MEQQLMSSLFAALLAACAEAPGWMLVTAGFAIAYRALRFPDLTVDASCIAGGVAAAFAAERFGSSVAGFLIALLVGGFAGGLSAGVFTLNPRPSFKLLSGVFVGFGMYSVNYLLLGGRVELGFATAPTSINLFADQELAWQIPGRLLSTAIAICCAGLLMTVVGAWLRSAPGTTLRFAVQRPGLAGHRRASLCLAAGLIATNACSAAGGFWIASLNGFATIGAGGFLIHALAGSILGEIIAERCGCDRRTSIFTLIAFPMFGALAYSLVRGCALWLFVEASANWNIAANQQHQNTFIAVLLTGGLMLVRWLQQRCTITPSDIEYIEEDL